MNFNDLKNWLIDPKTSDQELKSKEKFVKATMDGPASSLKSIGKSNPLLKTKSNEFYKANKSVDISIILEGLEQLMQETNLIESRVISCYILGKYKKQYNYPVFERVNRWIEDVDQWIFADHLCIDIYSNFPVYEKPYYDRLIEDVTSSNFWRRRISVVRFVKHVRINAFAVEKMLPLMDHVLDDDNYYVRKAIPWLLRESSKSAPDLVKQYLERNKSKLKKSELKEASKYLG